MFHIHQLSYKYRNRGYASILLTAFTDMNIQQVIICHVFDFWWFSLPQGVTLVFDQMKIQGRPLIF